MLEVKIIGDGNDADYEYWMHTISSLEETVLYRLNLEHDDLILSISFNWSDLLKHLAYAFKKTSETNPEKWDKHNWYRPEFDDFEEHAMRTCLYFLESIGWSELYIEPDIIEEKHHMEKIDDEEYDRLIEQNEILLDQVQDYIQSFLPYGEFGVHTVESIEVIPIGEKVTYL
ncbi:Uncharacterised protein [Acinetobacter phage MD-2021a]|nr:Uncharacterised protein [Acinetobacter phage MD-2021a]CAH1089015.1 Uncharacterised protein [Acinetobacter phage MD-2021a]